MDGVGGLSTLKTNIDITELALTKQHTCDQISSINQNINKYIINQ